MKIEEINFVMEEHDSQDINVVIKPHEQFFNAQESLALESSLPAKLLVRGEVSHTWVLDSRVSSCDTT